MGSHTLLDDDFSLDAPLGDVTIFHAPPAPPQSERREAGHTPGHPREQPLGRVVSLSLHSVRIEVTGHCPLNTGDHLALHLDDGYTQLQLTATLTHRDTTGFRRTVCTLRFDELPDPDRAALARLLHCDYSRLMVA